MITFVIGFILGSVMMAGAMAALFFVRSEQEQEPVIWIDEPVKWEDAPISEIPLSAKVGESAHI